MVHSEGFRILVLIAFLVNKPFGVHCFTQSYMAVGGTSTTFTETAGSSGRRPTSAQLSTDWLPFTDAYILTDANTCWGNSSSLETIEREATSPSHQNLTNASTPACFGRVSTAPTPFEATLPVEINLDYVGYVFVPLLMVLGLVGNTLTVRVMLTRSFRHLPVSLVLVALAVSDTMVNLLFPFNKPFVRQLLGGDIRAISPGGCKLFFWAYRYAKTTSSWMVVLISLERFVAVWLHTRAKDFNTKRNASIAIAVIYSVFAGFIGYWCSWADRIIGGSCIPNTRPPGLETRAKVFLVVGLSFYAFIPSAILVVFNALIVYRLLKVRMSKKSKVGPSTGAEKKDEPRSKTTTMLLGIAVAFVVLVVPVSFAHIVSFVRGVNIFETKDPAMVAFREITQLMEQMNNSINFFLYVICSRRFRGQLVKLLGESCLFRRFLGNSVDETPTDTAQTVPTQMTHQNSTV